MSRVSEKANIEVSNLTRIRIMQQVAQGIVPTKAIPEEERRQLFNLLDQWLERLEGK